MTCELIGDLVAEAVVRRLDGSGDGGRQLRVTKLDKAELSEVARRLEARRPELGADFRFYILSKPWPGGEPRWFLPAHRSATTLRNEHNSNGVGSIVLLQDQASSDQQGLNKIPGLDDGLLNDSEIGIKLRAHLVARAWDHEGGSVELAPAFMFDLLNELWAAIVPPLRLWVPFIRAIARQLAPQRIALDAGAVADGIGGCLSHLRLFPDDTLRSLVDAQRRRARFELNHRLSDDLDPKGKAVDEDALLTVVANATFSDASGKPLSSMESAGIRLAISRRLQKLATDQSIQLRHWLRLFDEKSSAKGLGQRVDDALVATGNAQSLADFRALRITDRLDDNDPAAATKLLDEDRLASRLPTKLKRSVERLAEPRASTVDDPLRWLFQELYAALSDSESRGLAHFELVRATVRNNNDSRSLPLFAFLFGRTLGGLSASRTSALNVDSALTSVTDGVLGHIFERTRDAEGTEPEVGWDPVTLELRARGARSALSRVEWRPFDRTGVIAHAAVYGADDVAWSTTHDSPEAWVRHLLEGVASPGDTAQLHLDGGADESLHFADSLSDWRDLRREHIERVRREGLSASALSDYSDRWAETVLARAYRELKPSGAPLPSLGAFLAVDTFRDGRGGVTLLASHPLRARWIARHFDGMQRSILQLLESPESLILNPVNDRFYFDSLAQLSPHEQPAVTTYGDNLFVAVREDAWHQHYAVARRPDRADDEWLSDLDDASVDELAKVVEEFIVAHPHKMDGIAVLILVRSGGARVLKRLCRKAFKGTHMPRSVRLHVFAARREAQAIEMALADFDDPERRADSDTPYLDVVVHPWNVETLAIPSLDGFDEEVDIALVPNLFGSHTMVQDATKSRMDGGAAFDPWRDRPTYIESGGTVRGENVTRVLLPERPDTTLELWSTLAVRGFRNNAVGSDIDYLTIQVRFDKSRQLFDKLHQVSQWVVTLDAFIGRDQIESLPKRPDVILVRPEVGKNQAYTLIVSSERGRDFVLARLRGRIRSDLDAAFLPHLQALAERLYDSSRYLAPGLLLRAVGLGWAAQELIGLVIARKLVDERKLVAKADLGFVAWLSLDEHRHWFGAGRSSRADLLRIAFWRGEDGRTRLRATVVEAKFRSQTVSDIAETADPQVTNTADLIRHALAGQSSEGADSMAMVDLPFWRREILRAVQELPRGDDPTTAAYREIGSQKTSTLDALAEDWIKGNYDLEPIERVICSISTDGKTDSALLQSPAGADWYRIGQQEFHAILAELEPSLPRRPPITAAVAHGTRDVGPPESTASTAAAEDAGDAPTTESTTTPDVLVADPVVVAPSVSLPAAFVALPSASSARGLTQAALELKYKQLLDVFPTYKVVVGRPAAEPFREGPGFFLFRVEPGPGVRPDAVRNLVDEIKLQLALPADAVPRSYIDRGCVVFEVPKLEHERYYVDAESLWARTTPDPHRLHAPIGEDIKGDVVEVDFSSDVSPHLLVAGQTGAGKSVALETILLGLTRSRAPDRLKLGLVDPKTTELTIFEQSPHLLRPIGWEAADAIQLLKDAVDEMESRRGKFRERGARSLPEYNKKVLESGDSPMPWWLLVLDEYADLTSDKVDKKAIEESLLRLAAKARASGIHVIVATQRPSADVISTVVRSNLVAQLALRVRSAMESNIVMAEAGAEALAGRGDAFFKNARALVRVQCGRVNA